MKVESIHIRNFKRFDDLFVSFKNSAIDEISNRFLILGDNGSGKTTILQAIALVLELATQQNISRIEDFDWIGFVPSRYARWGNPYIELVVKFTPSEIEVTRELARLWRDNPPPNFEKNRDFIEPGVSEKVTLILDGNRPVSAEGGSKNLYQLRGRHYAATLVNRKTLDYDTKSYVWSRFKDLPGIFYFDQYRNLGATLYNSDNSESGNGNSNGHTRSSITYNFGVDRLREYLNGWVLARQSPIKHYDTDYYSEIEKLYKTIFPGRSFAGVEPMLEMRGGGVEMTSKDYYFLLNDGNKSYDIVEMSAGEQAIFPILYDFVRLRVGNSVVLIDEIDLNLHPPAAQNLVGQLPRIGTDCQFIFTTHSESVSDIVSEGNTYRLPGGVL